MKFRWSLKTFIIDTLYFIGGSILYCLGIYTFALHAKFAPGGLSGLALIINQLTNLPIGIVTLVLNIPLVLLSLKVVGRTFMIKSIWTMIIGTIFMDLVFPRFPLYTGSPLLAAMFTGVSLGAGLAIIYMRGSSTGGSDFVIMPLKKKWPHFSVGQLSLAFDGAVILLGGLIFNNVDAVLYGIIASFACTLAIDNILYGAGSGKLAIIITDHGDSISRFISNEVGRGSTLVKSTGTYTGKERDMLFCACSKSEINKVRTAAHAADPGALVMITEVNEVIGEGFASPEEKQL